MKKIILFILSIFVLLFAYLIISYNTEEDFPLEEKQIMRAAGSTLGELMTPYGLKFGGIGFDTEFETGNHLKERVFLMLGTQRFVRKDEARILLVKYAEKFVSKINQIEGASNFLYKFPFSLHNIDMILILGEYHDPLDPDIRSVKLKNGIVTYKTIEPDEYHFSKYEKETIEEALEIVHGKTKENQ